jgi:hypothetical protein
MTDLISARYNAIDHLADITEVATRLEPLDIQTHLNQPHGTGDARQKERRDTGHRLMFEPTGSRTDVFADPAKERPHG